MMEFATKMAATSIHIAWETKNTMVVARASPSTAGVAAAVGYGALMISSGPCS